MAANQLMDQNRTTPVEPPRQPITGASPPPAIGTDALNASGAGNREIMPVTEQTVSRSSFEPPSRTVPVPEVNEVKESETVAGQMKQLLSEDSEYLEQGRQAGLTQASQRGLQNSSFAVQAGEQARIASALPIAQQDASTHAGRAELNQNTVNDFRRSEMDHIESMIQMAQQGDINSQLQLDQFGFNSSLSAQQNMQELERMALSGDIQARQNYLQFGYQSMLTQLQHGHALQLEDSRFQNSQTLLEQEFAQAIGLSGVQSEQRINEQNAQHENTLAEIAARSDLATSEQERNLGFQLQAQYLGQVAARQQAASEEIRIIMQTEGLSSYQQQSAVSLAQKRMDADINALQAFYAKSPQWSDDFGSAPAVTSGGAPASTSGGSPVVNPTPSPVTPYGIPGGYNFF